VTLPIVMDDALVNFDDTRATAAARTIVEFLAEQGSDRQMLVFTCHAHVATMFHEAGAHVRSLSDPTITWGRRREPVALPQPAALPQPEPKPKPAPRPKPEPKPAPTPEPLPVADLPPPSGDLWPAEAFFFGHHAAGTPAAARRDPPAAKPPRRRDGQPTRRRL
jgi:hypothetical protein